ncbi:MAG: diacylglycerol kinase family lipid kinase [Kouleothrix sp.]|jgi:YegS/Rv2252/BmrU family lipid kinase|nr:diacylglycerol kinase family lipid kinase [Kouleothrix sp.]
MTKLLTIINPWAGRGMAGRRRPELEDALRASGVEHAILATHARGGATELAWQGVEHGYDRIVAVGGDGTINEVVNGIKGAEASLGRRAQLGIIPLGTGSDFIKVLDGFEANDITGGVRRALGTHAQVIDLGRVQVGDNQPRYFINALGMGFDAQAAAEALKLTKLKGLAVYLVAIIRALASYKAHPMVVEYDGHRVHRRLLFASIANGRCQGGGFWLTPEALTDDGLLDLCLVDNMRIDEIIRHIPKVMEGTHTHLKQVTMGRARNITATCSASMPVATDGEVIATDARQVTVETMPSALEVLV